MKIIVAIDSFKGSASSIELNEACREVILEVLPEAEVSLFPIADGGEGSLEALSQALSVEKISLPTRDLLGRPIQASYIIVERSAFIESASVVGLDFIEPSSETFNKASSFGLGELIRDAVQKGCRDIYLSLGGTGSSDGGFGLLESLGFDFDSLEFKSEIDWGQITITGLADVTNPYYGEKGFAKVFGPQKGGTAKQIEAKDEEACAFARRMKEERGIDLQEFTGSGAAGGLGAAILIMGGQLKPGFETIAEWIGLEKALENADLIFTGEGKLDAQSQGGKVPVAISQMGKRFSVPTIALCGSVEDNQSLEDHFLATFSIQRSFLSLEEALDKEVTLTNLKHTVRSIIKSRFQ